MSDIINQVTFAYSDIDEAFPSVDPNFVPFGSRVLVQIRSAKRKTAGGIILTQDARDTEQWNTQVAKVISVGSLAFKNRNTQEPWPEGSWASPGDFVRTPKYGGDKWTVKHGPNNEDEVLFVLFNDLDLLGAVPGDPLTVKAFV